MTTDGFTTCLRFEEQAEEAANYYVSIFKDAKLGKISRYTEAGPARAGTVMTVEFELNGQKFVGLNGGPQFPFTEAVSFQIYCEDQSEVDRLWAALADGGSEVACGWIKDRWGLSWQIVPTRMIELLNDSDRDRARRAQEAMMKMVKIDIAEIERAANESS